MDDNGVASAARAIRPYLEQILGERAADTDKALAALLKQTRRITEELHSMLDADPATADFLAVVLADAPLYRPPDLQNDGGSRGGPFPEVWQGLPGDPGQIGADAYVCPHGDYTWYRRSIGVAVPQCPTHGTPLIKQDGGQ